jgi:hypothetical protein
MIGIERLYSWESQIVTEMGISNVRDRWEVESTTQNGFAYPNIADYPLVN